MTEAKKRANKKYNAKVKSISLRFYLNDTELYEYAKKLTPKGIRELIRREMNKGA